MWLRIAKKIENHIHFNSFISEINVDTKTVTTTTKERYAGQYIITTIPWNSVKILGVQQREILDGITQLKHTGVEIAYYQENQQSDAQWIYIPEEKISYHRILSRKAFCSGSHGYWTETNLERVDSTKKLFSYINKYAYPLNTINKPGVIKKLLEYMRKREIYGLGRWGEHEHYNSDVVVERAIQLADQLTKV